MKIETLRAGGLKFLRSLVFFTVCVLSVALCFTSCSKDDEEETSSSLTLEGSLDYYLPIYAYFGDTLTLEATGIITEGATYSWNFNGLDSIYLSKGGNVIKLVVPDSIAVFEITVTADCGDDYYSTSMLKAVTSIGPKSLAGVKSSEKYIVDERDNQKYDIVEIGNLEWFAENLNWAGAGAGYGKTEAATTVFGRLYTWQDATGGLSASGLGQGVQGVCPDGWSIPTNEDWMDLAMALNGGEEVEFKDNWKGIAGKLMAQATFNDNAVWPYCPTFAPTNDYGWNALASGSCTNNYSIFSNLLAYGLWWSSTERDSNTAYYRYIYYDFPDLSVNFSSKDNGFGVAVRCVRLKEQTNN